MRVSEDSQGEWKSERRERARQKEPFKTEICRRQTGEESEGGREEVDVATKRATSCSERMVL